MMYAFGQEHQPPPFGGSCLPNYGRYLGKIRHPPIGGGVLTKYNMNGSDGTFFSS